MRSVAPARPASSVLTLAVTLPLALLTFTPATGAAQDSVVLHVFDVGAGLCTVTEAPPGHYMVYDVGRWTGTNCVDAIDEVVSGSTIDLLVISHADSDHLGEVEHLLARFDVKTILRTGFERWSHSNWRDLSHPAAMETFHGASIINLESFPLVPGTEIPLGDATVTFVAGHHTWDDQSLGASDLRNVISIVLRLDYQGRSILYTGDAVGRSPGESATANFDPTCAHAERVMVKRHDDGVVSLGADVLIAPHHGANNASATCFIERVDPSWVLFSAGSQHGHPRDSTARRYLDQDVELDSIFRTDRGDNEDNEDEWKEGTQGCRDGSGDDAVRIVLTADGDVEVAYLGPSASC